MSGDPSATRLISEYVGTPRQFHRVHRRQADCLGGKGL